MEAYFDLFAQMVTGLVEIHGKAHMHRDLKPENVFLVRNGAILIAKLGDFGLARGFEASLASYTKGVGSNPYMSPEQHNHEQYGPSADVWALGVIAYEMLSGGHPFDSTERVLKAGPKPMPAWVKKEVQELVMNLLEKDPQKRKTACQI